MKQVLEEYALMAEIFSAFSIIISLIFVGLQIKGNTKATRASTFHEIAALDIQILLSLAKNQESARIITAYREKPEELSQEEQYYGFHMFAAEIRHVENLFLQNENKMLSSKDWESRKALVEGMVLTPAFGALLESPFKKFFDGSFIEFGANLRRKQLQENA